jgi:hypothetical protein
MRASVDHERSTTFFSIRDGANAWLALHTVRLHCCESHVPLLRERFFRGSMRFFNRTAKDAMLEFR